MTRTNGPITAALTICVLLTLAGAVGADTGKENATPHTTSFTPRIGNSMPHKAGSQRAERSTAQTDRFVPKNRLLKKVYNDLTSFRPDEALATLAQLTARQARTGLKLPGERLSMTRLLLLCGDALQMDENLPAARDAYYLAYKLSPDDSIALSYYTGSERGLQHFKIEQALTEQLAKVPKKSIPVYKSLARHFAVRHQYDVALLYLEAAEKLDTKKTDGGLQLSLARTYINQGRGDEALNHLRQAAAHTENPYVRELLLADKAAIEINDADFEKHVMAAGKIYPYDPIWMVKLGNYSARQGKDNEALKYLIDAINCKRFSSRALIDLAGFLSRTGRHDDALNTVRRLDNFLPPNSSLFVTKADVYSAKGDAEEAEKFYRQAIAFNPHESKAYESLALLLSQNKKDKQAIDVMNDCIKAVPSYWRARFIYANILLAAKDLKGAVDESKEGLSLLPSPESRLNIYAKHEAGRAHAIIGRQCYIQKRLEEATVEAKEFNRLKFNPDLPDVLKMVVIRPGRLQFSDKLGLKDPITRAGLGDMLLETGDLEDSVAEHKKAVALMPDNADLHSYLLHVLSEKGDWADAAKENFILSQKIVSKLPSTIGKWTNKAPATP